MTPPSPAELVRLWRTTAEILRNAPNHNAGLILADAYTICANELEQAIDNSPESP